MTMPANLIPSRLPRMIVVAWLAAASPAQQFEAVEPLVVMIEDKPGSHVVGAGVIFAKGNDRVYIATAEHVVRELGEAFENVHVKFRWLPGEWFPARILGDANLDLDLAVLAVVGLSDKQISVPADLPFDRFGDPSGIERGVQVWPLGNLAGRHWHSPFGSSPVSSLSRDFVESEGQMGSGYSGGALVSEQGSIVGMVIEDGVGGVLGRSTRIDRVFETLREWGYQPRVRELVKPKPSPQAGDTRPGNDGLIYVWIPPGTFDMGCSPGDDECDSDEERHTVRISNGFWLGQTEVTVGAYRRFVEKTGGKMPSEPNFLGRALNAGWKDAQQPIVNVNWAEARAYCEWAGGRLPTEAEWEYAARAGSQSARYGRLNSIAWSADNSGNPLDSTNAWAVRAGKDINKYSKILAENGNRIHPVGLKQANRWGLRDMLGNVWEWCSDWYDKDYYSESPAADPQGPGSRDGRVVRGGSWDLVPRNVRSSFRVRGDPGLRLYDIGFRCVGEVFP